MDSSLSGIAGLAVRDGELVLGDSTLAQLAARAGQTPFYVYSRQALTAQVRRLREHLPPELLIYYSIKANPMPALVQHLAGLVDGLDVASLRELRTALDTGIDPERCLITGPARTGEELRAAVASHVAINLESPEQMRRTAAVGAELGIRPRVILRLHPSALPARGHMQTYAVSQFGIDEPSAVGVLEEMKALDLAFDGFHIFWGSQFSDPGTICRAQRDAYDMAMRLADRAPRPPRFVSLGGGFAAPFYEGEPPLDLAGLGAEMGEWMAAANVAGFGGRIAIELGRYLVAASGVYVCRVVDVKTVADQTFVITDGGLHQHLAASGYFGQQAKRRNYVVRLGNKMNEMARRPVNVTGRLCSTLDRIADAVMLPEAAIGDYLVVMNSGAYGPSFSPGGFLSHAPAVEMLA